MKQSTNQRYKVVFLIHAIRRNMYETKSLHINNGDLKRNDNTLRFTNYEGEKRDIPIERVSDIYIISEMSFNTAFINYVSKYGIPIHFFNYYNFYTGSYYPKESLLAGQLLISQVEHYTDYEKRMKIARKFIPASNEPSSRTCADIWRLPRGSNTPLLCSAASLITRCLQRGL